MKTTLRLLAAAAMLATAAPAMAQSDRPPAAAAKAATPAQAGYTDAQLDSYIAAKAALRGEGGAMPTDAQKAAVLQRHGLDAATYTAIGEAARSDPALARKIAALQAKAAPPPKS
jgi:hypothetical protein